jgi:PTH1 family peptidyl-tRNA hydrolase
MVLDPIRNTLSHFVLGVFNLGMVPPRFLGRLARGISRAVQAHAASKRELSGPVNNLWLVVGLGNPGTKYDETRHNIGFRAVDEIASSNGIPMSKVKEKAQVGLGAIAGESVMLVKPLTFMNLSGESVGKLSKYYKVPRERVLVIYDDLDLPNAQVKLKLRGGHGGHNGMRSIIEHFSGKSDFPRLRIGIGRPTNGRIPIVKHVLQRFSQEERVEIDFAVQDCVSTVEKIMVDGMEKALSTCNNKKKPKKAAAKKPREAEPAAAEAK